MAETSAFELLHEGVRRQLWKMGWPELRPLQVDAIRHILSTGCHAVLSAATAAGKTEAAFLPILSAIADEQAGSIRTIYVGPLKALINDQFMRVEELCGYLDLPVHRWHGDVGASDKAKLIASPSGVLLITPESLESVFVNRSRSLAKLFRGLRFVVIDELHSFLDNERGLHLRSLLYRVAALTEKPVRTIGLSATIGDPLVAKAYIDRDAPDKVAWIQGPPADTELKLRMHAYVEPDPNVLAAPAVADDEEQPEWADMTADLVKHCSGRANLIFANSRNDVEYFGDQCRRLGASMGLPDEFMVHHGSLSADSRVVTEETMKQASRSGRPATTFCSSTLEMGIDIGNVHMVGQIGAPHSVASLKQRAGRSGRRDNAPRILREYIRCQRIDERSDLFDRLHLPFVQTIAVTELLLRGWVEPAEPSSFDLSTLTQQIISLIAETGARTAKELHRILCRDGVFRDVDASVFALLLRQLGAADVIEQTPQGDLILGLVGEDLRKDKGFYAAFMTADGFAVLHDGRRIGSVDNAPQINHHMILAGRRWKVTDVDDRQNVIYVVPASGSMRTPFAGGGGGLHVNIVAEMREVLRTTTSYTYLNGAAAKLLSDARHSATSAFVCTRPIIELDENSTAIFPWVGSRTLATIQAMFAVRQIVTATEHIALVVSEPYDDCVKLMNSMLDAPPDEVSVLDHLQGSPLAKYDAFLNPELLTEVRKRRWLDLHSAQRSLACALAPKAPTKRAN